MESLIISTLIGIVVILISSFIAYKFSLKQQDIDSKRKIYNDLLISMYGLKAKSDDLDNETAEKFCRARTASLLIGSINFLHELRKYEKCMMNPKAPLVEVEVRERDLIKCIRTDLKVKNHQGLLNAKDFPDDIYFFNINTMNKK
jgi:hypothetical protein